MILVEQGENHRILGIGNPVPDLPNNEIQILAFTFLQVKSGEDWIFPLGYPEFKLKSSMGLTDATKINKATLEIVTELPEEEDPNIVGAYTFFRTATVGDALPDFDTLPAGDIKNSTLYDLNGDLVEKFILANGLLTGVQI